LRDSEIGIKYFNVSGFRIFLTTKKI
jgi:hypothetical protein